MADGKKSSIGGKTTCHLLNIKEPTRVAKRLKVAFQRTNASISIVKQGKTVDATMGLIDISESGAGFFTEALMGKGSIVEITLKEPRPVKIKGKVAWSIPISSGIQKRSYGFRSGLQFVFESEIERTALLDYIKSISMDPTEVHQLLKQEKNTAETTPVAQAPASETVATEPAVAEAAPANAPAEPVASEPAPAAEEATASDESKKAA